MKTGLEPLGTGALDKIVQLRPVRFRWRNPADRTVGKDLPLSATDVNVGFIAQEVQKVVPEAVVPPKDANGVYGLKEADLIPVMVQSIKELKAQVDALKAQVASLTAAQPTAAD